jgi:NADH-quinone oxidoreductase subunit J
VEATIQTILFWFFSILAIGGGIGLLLNRNPVYAALAMVINLFSIAGLFLSLNAEFLAVIQILVYAGAIMVLFLFVITLLNLTDEQNLLRFDIRRGLGFVLGLAFLGEMFYILRGFAEDKRVLGEFEFGTAEELGKALMTEYIFPFEIISVILLAALIGAIAVARRYQYDEA